MNSSDKINVQLTLQPAVSLQFEIPNVLADFIREQTIVGGFKTEGEYLLDLVKQDQIRAARDELEIEILKGLNSQTAGVEPREYLQQKRAEIERRAANGEFPP